MSKYNLTILIPVFNEQKTILEILKKTTSLNINKYQVIVVNDCSVDKSPEIINKFAKTFKSKNCHLDVINHEKNLGKGSGIRTALKFAEGEYFVVQDADLEYDPKDIEMMIGVAAKNDYPVLYGSRFLGDIKTMPKANYIANKTYNFILRFLYDTKVSDMHTCYKMVKTSLIKSFKMKSAGFEYATELIGNILSRGIDIHEVPISFKGRTKKEGKKIDVKDGIICAYQIVIDYLKFRGYYGELSILIKFLLVGSIGFITNYLVITLLQDVFSWSDILRESVVSTFVAINITFILHDKWTYKKSAFEESESRSLARRYRSYVVSNLIGAGLTIAIITLITKNTNTSRLVALSVASLAVLVWNYTINKVFIWKIVPKNLKLK